MDGPLPSIIIVGDSNHFAPSVDYLDLKSLYYLVFARVKVDQTDL